MNAKLIVNNKEISVEISEEQLKSLLPQKRTGYERVNAGERYYAFSRSMFTERNSCVDDMNYDDANYCNDETLAKNLDRADKLMRQLRRFAVEHRDSPVDWTNQNSSKCYICYDYDDCTICVYDCSYIRNFGQIYFDTYETAQLAIDTFYDELIWYFTEFKDSL